MRLQSIDSLRGIAALAVVVFHVWGMQFRTSPTLATALPGYGYAGVFLFFAISGFCIHLRYAKGREPQFFPFWKRRWIRLYPAYLASIALYLWWIRPELNWMFWYDIYLHLLMLHNLDARTVYSVNGVWWTLAIEEQLYLLYFLLLWIRHQWGWKAVLTITFGARFVWLALSLALHYAGVYELPFHEGALANWWTWALGALAVEAYVGKVRLPKWCYSLLLATGLLMIAAVLDYSQNRFTAVVSPIFWGGGFFVILNRFVRDSFSLTWLAGIGLFSYSLYLTHEFIIAILPAVWVVPASLLFAWAFYRVFEKPFMHTR